MKTLRCALLLLMALMAPSTSVQAQLYTGLTGLIHAPSAEMNAEGTARIGGYFLSSHFTPDQGFSYGGEKYNTAAFSVSVVPYSWVEVGYTFTLMKTLMGEKPKYNAKDRYFSVKLRPLKEGKYWPAVVVGANDLIGSRGDEDGSLYFSNYYVAATKHVDVRGYRLGVHAAYRKYRRAYNAKWEGLVGGITCQPAFAPNLRGIVEYDGDGVNVGVDCLLWRHLFLQGALQGGKHFSGGLCWQVNLF